MYITYKNIEGVNFPWSYEDLMKLPLFMIQEIYTQIDKQAEIVLERKRKMAKMM